MSKNIGTLIIGILTAIFFSAFIYLEHYGYTIKLLNTLFGLISIGLFLYIPKRSILVAGFSIGLLWFYWIGYSFEYQGVGYMTPIVTFGFAIIYMLFFGILALSNKVYIRAILLFALSFFEPFDWNWMQVELVFVDSYIGIFKYQFLIVLTALSIPFYIKNNYKYLSLLLLIFAFSFNQHLQKDAPLKIKLVQTDIKQEEKWLRKSLEPTILLIYKEIENGIKNNYDVIILPESVFPLYLNKNKQLLEQLIKLSYDITIVAGSLLIENTNNYNVTYMFENGDYQIAKKLVLVPFGEYIPLPKFAKNILTILFSLGLLILSQLVKQLILLLKA